MEENIHVLDKKYGTQISVEEVLDEIYELKRFLKKVSNDSCVNIEFDGLKYPDFEDENILNGLELTDFHLNHHLEMIRKVKCEEQTNETKCFIWFVQRDILSKWLFDFAGKHWSDTPSKLIHMLDIFQHDLELPIFYLDILYQLIDGDNYKVRSYDDEKNIHYIGYSMEDRKLLISKLDLLKNMYRDFNNLDDSEINDRMHVLSSFIDEGPPLLVLNRLPMEIIITQFEPTPIIKEHKTRSRHSPYL